MSNRLPVEVNPFRLIEQRQSLSGMLSLTRLHRLRELLCREEDDSDGKAGKVSVELDFDKTETGLPLISGTIDTELDLTCQRCLNKLTHRVQASIEVIVVTSDAQAERLQEGYDICLVEDDRLFIPDFIEDEILLTLPLSMMHKDCEPERPYIEGLAGVSPDDEMNKEPNDRLDKAEKNTKDNPFAALKELKEQKDLE